MKAKFLVTLLMLGWVAVAHASIALPDACGKDEIQYKVKTQKQGSLGAVETGKAQIILIEELSGTFSSPPTVRFAIDGNWVGADRGLSYFAVSVAPGEHQVCASRQSGIKTDKENFAVKRLHVESGNIYFYRFKVTRTEIGSPEMAGGGTPGKPRDYTIRDNPTIDSITFDLLEEDSARTLLKTTPASLSNPK